MNDRRPLRLKTSRLKIVKIPNQPKLGNFDEKVRDEEPAWYRVSAWASHLVALGWNPGFTGIFSLLLSLWTVERLSPSSA